MKLTTFCATACLSLSSLFLGSPLEAFPKTKLTAPFISKDVVTGTTVSVHDYRERGIRVEPTYIREKLIIHNYGHGGASLPLSWGSVHEAFEYLELEVLSDEFVFDFGKVAVLGSGVLGLTTANFLLDRGYKVCVYSEKFPPYITNDPLEGLWWPTAVSSGRSWQEKAAFKRIVKNSYNHFKELAESDNPDFVGVTKKTIYSFDQADALHNDAIEDFFGSGVYVAVTFDTGVRRKGICYDTFHIEPNAYIHSLFERALAKGAVFVHRSFKGKEELENLEENLIFNCLGKGSKLLFDDEDLSTVRHQTVTLMPQDGVDYMLRVHAADDSKSTHVFALDDKIILGGGYQYFDANSHADPAQTERMLESANSFFKE